MASIFKLRRGSGSVSLTDGELYIDYNDSLKYTDNLNVTHSLLPLGKSIDGNIDLTGSISLNGSITASDIYVGNNLFISGNLTVQGTQTSLNVNEVYIEDKTLTLASGSTSSAAADGAGIHIAGANISMSWHNARSGMNLNTSLYVDGDISGSTLNGVGNVTLYSSSVDGRLDTSYNRLDVLELSASLYDNVMSGSLRLYVSPEGKDTNDGSDPSVPFKTIKAAVESLGAAEYTNIKRYTIFVGSGNYTENNPIVVPPGVAIVGDTLRTVRLTAQNPKKDYFHCHDSNYFYGLRLIDLEHPAFSFSYPCSTATCTISGGSISSINLIHSMSGYPTNQTNYDIGIVIEGPDASGSIATATINTNSSGVITQVNVLSGGTNYTTNEKPHISIPAPLSKRPYITTSPYIQNCSSITGPFQISNGAKIPVTTPLPYDTSDVNSQGAGGGIRIDGNLVYPDSPLESMVADAFTQVNQGGPGHLVINKGYAQFVSCFTTFCTYGFKVANGGFANISNSVIDFGNYGLISKTYFPQTYNTGSSLETKTSTVSGFIIDENGAGYTGSIASVTITGGGASVQATAEATVNANGSIDEIVVLTGGSGYTAQPSVTIAPPTGAGAIQATTVAGKALISGVSEILMSLQSGSRGIDISSNMILNGVDYLVTNVATVSGQANQRRVTTYPAPPSITTGNNVYFHQLSNISTGGLVMEYVGSGVTYNALPKFGGVPVRTREINEFAPGRVFYTTVDNIGNIKVGDFFAVNQLTGEVTIDANSFNLSGLNTIGPFKRNGVGVGVVLQEVSNNTTLLNSQGLYGEDTVPTQYAVKGYIDPISASLDSRLDSVEYSASYVNSQLNTLTTNLTGVVSGSLQISALGFISASQTSSMNVNSASYALTASYALNAGTTVNTGSLITTSSFNSFSQSIVSRVSSLESGGGGSAGNSGSFLYEQASPAITWSITHDLNYEYPSVTVYDSNNKVIIPDEITSVSENALTITFASAEGGWAHISIGGGGSATLNLENINIGSSRYLHKQLTAATTWSVTHNLEYDYPSVTVYDSDNRIIIPDEITSVSENALTITFASAELGRAHISVGGISNLAGDRYLHTQSNVSDNWIISHSLDFKYVNIDVYDSNDQILLPQTITAQDANTTVVTFATPTSGNAIISKGGATLNLENINIDSSRYLHIQSTAATTWSVTHSLEYDYPSVTVYDNTDKIIIPDEITRVTNNTLTISFASAESGNAHISVGGISNLAGDRYLHTQSSVSNNWVISHNLNWQYVNIDVYDANNQLLIPQSVTATDEDTTTIVFVTPTSGKAIISKGGATVNSPLTSNGPNAYILAGALEVVGNVTATGYITTSDIRLKTNLEEIGGALHKIEQLNAYTYDWIDTYNSDNIRQIGLISQEVKEVQPELVYEKEMLIGDQLERVLLLDYSKVTTLLIGAVKELSNKVKELEKNRF
jgi:hypothetical protein